MTDDRNRLNRDHDETGLKALRDRILAAGGDLAIWGILDEDTYETAFGDGLYLHLRGVALTEHDADRLAASAATSTSPDYKWHVRPYRLELTDGMPTLAAPWPRSEEFRLDDVVAIMLTIPKDGTSSDMPVVSA